MVTAEGLDAVAASADGIGPSMARIIAADGNGVDDNDLVREAQARGLVVHPCTTRADRLPAHVDTFEVRLQLPRSRLAWMASSPTTRIARSASCVNGSEGPQDDAAWRDGASPGVTTAADRLRGEWRSGRLSRHPRAVSRRLGGTVLPLSPRVSRVLTRSCATSRREVIRLPDFVAPGVDVRLGVRGGRRKEGHRCVHRSGCC